MIIIRPDITFTIRKLSSFSNNLSKKYLRVLKKVLRYLRSNPSLGIIYTREGSRYLTRYSNSNFAIDKLDRKLVLRNIFILHNVPIS